MKVAIYSAINPCSGYGAAIWIKHVAIRLTNSGHCVAILTLKSGDNTDATIKQKLLGAGVKVIEFDHYERPFILPKISSIIKMAKLLRNVDILYFINQFSPNEILLYTLKKIYNIKIISAFLGSQESEGLKQKLYHKLIDPILNKRFDANHVVNKKRGEILRSQGCKRIYRIPNGVDTNKFVPGIKDDIFTVMFAGRLVRAKGIYLLAKVIEHLNNKSNTDIKFLIFGNGPLSCVVEQIEEKFQNVKFHNYVNEQGMIEAYSKSHIFLLPSYFDEFPITVLEAQAAGIPVVATNIPAMKEMVISGVTGLLVNIKILEETICAVSHFKNLWYNKRQEYQMYSLNARRHVTKYDWEIVIKQIDNMFTRVAKT